VTRNESLVTRPFKHAEEEEEEWFIWYCSQTLD